MFKTSFSEEEMAELFKWFEERKGQLPKDLYLDEATYSPNLQETVDKIMNNLRGREVDKCLAGLAHILLKIKEKVS